MYDGHMLIRAQLSSVPPAVWSTAHVSPQEGRLRQLPTRCESSCWSDMQSLYIVTRRQHTPFNKRLVSLRWRECVFMSQLDTLWLGECAWCIHGLILHSLGLFCPYRRGPLFTRAACRKAAASIMQRQHFMPHSD